MQRNKAYILNSFFSRNTLRQCIETGTDNNYKQVVQKFIKKDKAKKTNLELISDVYQVLVDEYRNEYYYKNTLLNKLLLGVHSINTTTALTELAIANSKADFVMINGKAVVYEIKTELDNLERLENQINDYYKAFDHVAVVTYLDNLTTIERMLDNISKPIGIYVVYKKGIIKTIRKPEVYRDSLDIDVIYKLLRKNEYEEILLKYYGELPQVSEFMYYKYCRDFFLQIPIESLYIDFLKILKRRAVVIKEEYEKIPYELKFLTYFMKFKTKDYIRLESFLKREFGG